MYLNYADISNIDVDIDKKGDRDETISIGIEIDIDNNKKTPVKSPKQNNPSPFKKCLFWPETPLTSKKKGKEKISSVTTSQSWREYNSEKLA